MMPINNMMRPPKMRKDIFISKPSPIKPLPIKIRATGQSSVRIYLKISVKKFAITKKLKCSGMLIYKLNVFKRTCLYSS